MFSFILIIYPSKDFEMLQSWFTAVATIALLYIFRVDAQGALLAPLARKVLPLGLKLYFPHRAILANKILYLLRRSSLLIVISRRLILRRWIIT